MKPVAVPQAHKPDPRAAGSKHSRFRCLGLRLELCCLSAAALLLSGPASGADLDSARAARLARSEIIVTRLADDNPQVLGGQAEGMIAAPIERVWASVNDFARYPEFMPNVVKTWIIGPEALASVDTSAKWTRSGFEQAVTPYRLDASDRDTLYLYEVLDMPFPVGERWCLFRVLRSNDEYWQTWQEVLGNLRSDTGFWRLESSGDQTIATYVTRPDVGITVPGVLVSFGLKQTLPDVINAIRKEAE